MVSLAESSNFEDRKLRQQNIFSEDKTDVCPFCGSTEVIFDDKKAEVSCARCGLVLDDQLIDQRPEWRAFDNDQRMKRTRVGAPSTLAISDKGLNTEIDWRNKDSKGNSIPSSSIAQIYRLRKWNKRMRVSRAGERNLAYALSELDRVSSGLGIPRSVREDSASIYRDAAKKNLVRGRSIDSIVAASIYLACRRNAIPRTLDEISDESNVSKKIIGKNYRYLSRKLNIKLQPTSPADYISRFASKLELSGNVEAKSVEIINDSIEKGLNIGKDPSGIAAASLYISSILLSERKTQKEIADVVGVTEVTIRNRYKELNEQFNLL